MTPVLIGYFPKRTLKRPDWLKAVEVDEVCSVSECVSQGPRDWMEHWQHNAMWVFDTPELAWSFVPNSAREDFDLYAFQMLPVLFANAQREAFEIPPLRVAPLPSAFERLGYDVVSRSQSSGMFEHSPLSCNHMAEHVTVNHHCLLDDVDAGFHRAAEFEAGGCEPGPYCVVEVWRQSHLHHPRL